MIQAPPPGQPYRIHFGFSKSKHYKRALALAAQATQHEIRGSGEDAWHIVTFADHQISQMALLFSLTRSFRLPRIAGAEVGQLHRFAKDGTVYVYLSTGVKKRVPAVAKRLMADMKIDKQAMRNFLDDTYLTPIHQDSKRVLERLTSEGFFPSYDETTGVMRPARRRLGDDYPPYKEIRDSIARGQYTEAIDKYYAVLGDKPYGDLHPELIYLKRLAKLELAGRDLLAFRPDASRTDLIEDNLQEYCSCIDAVVETYKREGRSTPLDVLIKSVSTVEELVKHGQLRRDKMVSLRNGQVHHGKEKITVEDYGFFKFPKGILFDRYTNPLIYHHEMSVEDAPYRVKVPALWTKYSPEFVEREVLKKGLSLGLIEAYRHKLWRRDSAKRDPDFSTLNSLSHTETNLYGVDAIRYTGRTVKIEGSNFYEVDLLEKQDWYVPPELPRLENLTADILREAENVLRKRHGIPEIGEGWVSEMQLYDVVKRLFPDAQHHYRPVWLRPQELDIYVPSLKLAIEYQGLQHYQPLDFFGGEEAFKQREMLDKRKKRKCRLNRIVLIEWRFDEPINHSLLLERLEDLNKK
jgi:hypothetical protein